MFRKLTVLHTYVQSLLRHQRGNVVLSIFIAVFSGLTQSGSFVLLLPLLNTAGSPEDISGGSRAFSIANSIWNAVGIRPTLYSCLVSYVLLISTYAALGYIKRLLDTNLVQAFKQNLRNDLFSAVIDAEWGYIKNQKSPHIFNNLITETDNIGYATAYLLTSLSTAVILLVYTAISLYISFSMTLVAVASFLPLIIVQRHLNTKAYANGKANYAQHKELFKAVLELINSIKLAKSHNVHDRYKAEFEGITRQTSVDAHAFAKLTARTSILYEVGSAIIISLILVLAITVVQIPVVDLLLMVYIASKLLPSFSSLISNVQYLLNTLPSYEGVTTMLSQAQQQKEQPTNRLPLLNFPKQAITFSEVDFSYEPGQPILSRFTGEIKVGKTTSIVGASGRGKTTLIDLLLGLLKPQQGTIRLDGVDLNTLNLAEWRGAVAYIPQECFLFHTTIRKNLLWSKPEATDDDLHEVLTLAAGNFVFALPNGLDTVVGDQGMRLSGGERQRIALARALLRQPQLLILDEATNALDNANESIIKKAIDKLKDKITILLISHSSSFREGADHVLLVE